MFGRLISKAVFLAIILSAIFFGIGLLGFALAHALVNAFGVAVAYAIAGGTLLAIALVLLAFMALSRPRKSCENPFPKFAGLACRSGRCCGPCLGKPALGWGSFAWSRPTSSPSYSALPF